MKRLTFIVAVLMVAGGATMPLPTPKFAALLPVPQFVPMPQWTAETVTVVAEQPVVKHTGKPTVRPMRVAHSVNLYVHPCLMCRGQHLRNMHGRTYAEANKELWKWDRRHPELHRTQAQPKVQPQQCCPDGNCGGWYPGKLLGRGRGR